MKNNKQSTLNLQTEQAPKQIIASKNYGWFKFYTNNREIEPVILKNLREQFQKYGNITEISPINVNPHGFIYDGQHRYILCQEFGYPVNYIEVDMPIELTPDRNRTQRPWSTMNYVNFFAKYKPEYELLRRFIGDNNVSYSVASSVIFSGMNRKWFSERKLRAGTLEVKPYLKQAQIYMDTISEISEVFGAVISAKYARGIVKCLTNEEFDLDRFMSKLRSVMKTSPTLPNPRLGAIEDVMRNLESIYNYKAGEGSRVILFR